MRDDDDLAGAPWRGQSGAKANGAQANDASSNRPLEMIDPRIWDGAPVPERRWIVLEVIPEEP